MPALARGPTVVVLALGCLSGCDFPLCPPGPDGGLILDTTPPQITCPGNITKPQDPGACTAVTTFSPTFSDDCSPSVVCDPPSGTAFPLGTTTDTCTVTEQSGFSASCSFTVTVTDTVPPVIASIVASPDTLWPPNHKLVPVSITASATDNCDPSLSCRIVSVSANEPVLGPGSGNTDPDWVITDPGPKVSPAMLGVALRAERAGGGTGRVYRIDTTCADASGNTTAGATTVTVPHDQGH
jgi:HYR domain